MPFRTALAGDIINLSFFEPLKPGLDISLSRFKICQNNRRVRVESIRADSTNGLVEFVIKESDLSFDNFGNLNGQLWVSYFDSPGDQANSVIENIDGIDVDSFREPVRQPPPMSSDHRIYIVASHNVINLQFELQMDIDSIPSTSMFKLSVNGEIRDIEKITPKESGREFNLQMKSPVLETDFIHLSYIDPRGDQSSNVLQDRYGNDVQTLASLPVDEFVVSQPIKESNSSYDGPNLTDQYITGQRIKLVFDELISPNKLRKKLFGTFLDGEPIKIKRLRVNKNKIAFSPFNESDILSIDSTILVRYQDIKGDQKKGVIQDMLGVDSQSFMTSEFIFSC